MSRLSRPLTELKNRYTVVVIGTGYGGSIAASRLSRAGQSVCVLERGKEWHAGDFPDGPLKALGEMQASTVDGRHGPATGLFDFHFDKDISVLRGCGLGGTSLINANVSLKADPRVFDDERWPSALRADTGSGLAQGYLRAEVSGGRV
jgi:cholesterol oxidase